jgi:tRNA(Arg) A34 adenosine deaminase TadA
MKGMADAFMSQAIALAIENVRSGKGGPFAAVIVHGGKVIATGTNQVTCSNDPTAHAEVVAIRAACKALNSFQLTDCDIYASCEPCPMCLGAIYWARPRTVFYGASAKDAARAGFDDRLIYEEIGRAKGERKIPFVPLMKEEALAAFEAWKAQTNRVDY